MDRQDAAQTYVTQFLPAPKRQTPDYYALSLADTVFGGGGFGTRLNLNLREDKGYSYGVFSALALYDDAGVWYSAGGVQTTKTKESVVEFDKELKGMTAKPLTEAEFADTKARKTRGYAQQFETIGRINDQIADLWASALPMAELQREYDDTVEGDAGRDERRRAEVGAAGEGVLRPGRRLLEDRAGARRAQARRDRAAGHGREAGHSPTSGEPATAVKPPVVGTPRLRQALIELRARLIGSVGSPPPARRRSSRPGPGAAGRG